MDLLARARAVAACSLFVDLAPAVVIRLAERARTVELAAGERRTTADSAWVIVEGELAITGAPTADPPAAVPLVAGAGRVLGLIRVIAPATPPVEATATVATTVIALAHDDVRDVLEEDPIALTALAEALAGALLKVGG